MRQIAFATVLGAMLLAWPAADPARANDVCSAGCSGDLRTCVTDGVTAKVACRADCKSAGGHVGSCMRECRAAFRDQRTSCRELAQTCAADCAPGDESGDGQEPGTHGNPACPGRCGQALGRCLHAAAGGMPDCLGQCAPGRERHSCVAECQSNATGGSSDCRAEHQQCLAACGGGTSTTTSTTETTATSTTTSTSIPPPVLCGDAEAPTCDGSCPDVGTVCAETEPGVCGCVGGSADAAFIGHHHGRR